MLRSFCVYVVYHFARRTFPCRLSSRTNRIPCAVQRVTFLTMNSFSQSAYKHAKEHQLAYHHPKLIIYGLDAKATRPLVFLVDKPTLSCQEQGQMQLRRTACSHSSRGGPSATLVHLFSRACQNLALGLISAAHEPGDRRRSQAQVGGPGLMSALKAPAPALGSCASASRGLTAALQCLSVTPSTSGRRLGLCVEGAWPFCWGLHWVRGACALPGCAATQHTSQCGIASAHCLTWVGCM